MIFKTEKQKYISITFFIFYLFKKKLVRSKESRKWKEKKSIEEREKRLLEENKANKKNNKKHQRKKSYVNIPGLSEY